MKYSEHRLNGAAPLHTNTPQLETERLLLRNASTPELSSVDIHSGHLRFAILLHHTKEFPSISFVKRSVIRYKI